MDSVLIQSFIQNLLGPNFPHPLKGKTFQLKVAYSFQNITFPHKNKTFISNVKTFRIPSTIKQNDKQTVCRCQYHPVESRNAKWLTIPLQCNVMLHQDMGRYDKSSQCYADMIIVLQVLGRYNMTLRYCWYICVTGYLCNRILVQHDICVEGYLC